MTEVSARLTTALADRYTIERELGAGGMATVYLGHDVKHDRKVALKVLRPELAAVLGAERFVQEIKTTASRQHPHILPLFDSGSAEGFLYYVMPYVEGETLRTKLDRETQLGIDEALKITTEVADALDYALAYQSTESGREEVYVRPWPSMDANYLISSGGGTEPIWSPDGRELYYRHQSEIMAATVTVRDGVLEPGPPRVLFSGPFLTDCCGDQSWDVAPDGRLLMMRTAPGGQVIVRVALNWIAEVRARLESAQ